MRTAGEILPFIDIGSNAVRCLLVKVTPGDSFEILCEERAPTRLGGGCPRVLPHAAIAKTIATIARFLERARADLRSAPPARTLAIATAAVRDAANREKLLGPLEQEFGVRVWVLSEEEEARLGVLAVSQRLAFREGTVLDLGGGSLQISQIRAGAVRRTASFPLGAVRATTRFFKHDPPAAQEIAALREEVERQVRRMALRAREGEEMVGIGGTVRALASMHIATLDAPRPARQGWRLRRADITALREQLQELPVRERRRLPGLKEDRLDSILAGAVVVETVMALGGREQMTVCEDGVRHGVLWREVLQGSL